MIRDPESFEALRQGVNRFVRERLVPIEQEVDANDHMPDEIIQEMKEMGLFGLSIPEQYGGLELTMEEEVSIIFEIGQAAPAFRATFGPNVGIGSQGLMMDGRQEQKDKYLPKLATGEIIASFALTEPESGSDARSMKTTAVRDGDHYVLNGTKRFITNAPTAGLITVYAKSGTTPKGEPEISAFLVEAGTKGLSIGKPEKKMGNKGSQSSDVILEDCRIPADCLLGDKEGMGFRTAMKVLDRGRLHIASMCVGVSERLIDLMLEFSTERVQFGQPIANFQLIQAMIADSKAEAYAARNMVVDAARRRDNGENISTEAACCKLFASEAVGRIADRAVQIHGGSGYIQEYAVERLYRDVRLLRIYEGTTQIQQLVIARNLIRDWKRAS